jgi:hypothetical protein
MIPSVICALLMALVLPATGAAPVDRPPADTHARRRAVSPLVAKALGPKGELRGMALNDVGADDNILRASVVDFPRMAADGITSVSAYVYLYVADPQGTEVIAGKNTPSDEDLQMVADAARESGLTLHLTPVLLDTGTNTWRGRYQPSDINAFFKSYTTQVVRYARLAQQLGITLFFVGSENDSIAKYAPQWRSVVRAVRKEFRGAVSYMSTGYTPLDVTWWDALDLAAISVYFSMGEDVSPTYERFLAAWREVHTPYVRRLVERKQLAGKPLIFAETGYHSQQSSFAHPHAGGKATDLPAPAAQANGYAAMLDVLRANPSVYGLTWWRWGAVSIPADTSYAPSRKPAECVIAARWSPDADVREAAGSGPTCDLAEFDAALAAVQDLLPAR